MCILHAVDALMADDTLLPSPSGSLLPVTQRGAPRGDRRWPPKQLVIEVCGLGGDSWTVHAGPQWTGIDVKEAVQRASGISLHQQHLILGELELKDTSTLEAQVPECGAAGSDIQVTLIRRDPEQSEWLNRVSVDGRELRNAPEGLREDRLVVLAAVRQRAEALQYAGSLRADAEVALAAVQRCPAALHFAANALRGSRDFAVRAVVADTTGTLLRFLEPQLREDREVALAAVRRNWRALEHVPVMLRSDEEIVNVATLQSLEAFKLVDAKTGLRAGLPPPLVSRCEGRLSEFGARIVFPQEMRSAGTDAARVPPVPPPGQPIPGRGGTRGAAHAFGIHRERRPSRPLSCNARPQRLPSPAAASRAHGGDLMYVGLSGGAPRGRAPSPV